MFLWWHISNLPLYRKSTSGTSSSHQVLPSCASTLQPLGLPSFLARQKTLARTLLDLNASAYVSEPGPNSLVNLLGDGSWCLLLEANYMSVSTRWILCSSTTCEESKSAISLQLNF